VFQPEEKDAFGSYRRGIDLVKVMLQQGDLDLDDPETCSAFYRRLYTSPGAVDRDGLRGQVEEAMFNSVAENYHFIEEVTTPVVILYPPRLRRVESLLGYVARAAEPAKARRILRLLQPYLISLRNREVEEGSRRGYIETRGGVLVWSGPYDMQTGIGPILFGSPQERGQVRPSISGSHII
jgi:hypothetical protein